LAGSFIQSDCNLGVLIPCKLDPKHLEWLTCDNASSQSLHKNTAYIQL